MRLNFYVTFVLAFETLSIVAFKIIHSLYPSTLIYDQIFYISIFVLGACMILFRYFYTLNLDKVIASLCLAMVLMSLNQTFLLNIDRSRSTFVLAWVDKNLVYSDNKNQIYFKGVESLENLNQKASAQRVLENVQRGLIEPIDRSFRLTASGKFLLGICEFSADFFDLRGWKENSK